jgi:hypothetical protein
MYIINKEVILSGEPMPIEGVESEIKDLSKPSSN